MLYSEVFRRWSRVRELALKPTTFFRQTESYRVHIGPAFGDCEVEEIATDMVVDFVSEKREHGSPLRHPGPLADSSVSKILSILRMSLKYAVAEGIIERNPCEQVYLRKSPPKRFVPYTPEEVRKLVAAARPKWLGDAVLIAYKTGMRRGEVFGLQWGDVDFSTHTLRVDRSVAALKPGDKIISTPKTKRSYRTIEIDQEIIDLIKKRMWKAQRFTRVPEWVMYSKYGELLSPWYTTKYMTSSQKRAEIPHKRFHDLRHTHASMLISAGVNPKIVQERLGHSNIMITMDTYNHVLPSMQRAAMSIVAAM